MLASQLPKPETRTRGRRPQLSQLVPTVLSMRAGKKDNRSRLRVPQQRDSREDSVSNIATVSILAIAS